MSDVKKFVSFAKDKLKEQDKNILNCSGKILYSSNKTLKSGKVYLLGYNPGGDPKNHNEDTIEYELDNLHQQIGNSYIDEKWKNNKAAYKKGEHPLQKGVKYLLESLGEKPEEVCASNLIFKRSIGAKDVNSGDADTCWPVHERILQIISPKLILSFGIETYYHLKVKLGNNSKEITCKSGHHNWNCRLFKSESGVVVVGLPHLSIYKIYANKNRQNVINWIRQHLP